MATILMQKPDDILKVICENIGDISSLINVSYTCKIMKESVVSTTLYKEKKQEKYNFDLCYNIDDLVVSKILKNMRNEDYSDIMMTINEEKKKLNKGCLETLANIIHNDYCDYVHSNHPRDHYIAFEKSPIIKDMIVEIDADYKIYMDNWWIDDNEEQWEDEEEEQWEDDEEEQWEDDDNDY